jgi:hypothetical protein
MIHSETKTTANTVSQSAKMDLPENMPIELEKYRCEKSVVDSFYFMFIA